MKTKIKCLQLSRHKKARKPSFFQRFRAIKKARDGIRILTPSQKLINTRRKAHCLPCDYKVGTSRSTSWNLSNWSRVFGPCFFRGKRKNRGQTHWSYSCFGFKMAKTLQSAHITGQIAILEFRKSRIFLFRARDLKRQKSSSGYSLAVLATISLVFTYVIAELHFWQPSFHFL